MEIDNFFILTLGKSEEIWHRLSVGQASVLVAQLVEVGIEQRLQRSGALRWVVA